MPQDNEARPNAGAEMSVWDHLEELRWVVVRAVIGIIVGIAICAIFGDFILKEIVLAPAQRTTPPMRLINTEVFGQLSLYMQVAIWGGVILSFPYTLISIWKFIAPGLHEHEKKYVGRITFFTVFLFILGMSFAYYVMLPMSLDFAVEFGTLDIQNLTDISKYLSLFLQVIILSGLVFELPAVSYFLSKMGILTPAFMRHYRRHTIVILLLLSAVLSPGGNPLLQLILFVPLWALFELSIGSSALVERQRRKEELAGRA
jgi:sec-independent protein translocase protein TatC